MLLVPEAEDQRLLGVGITPFRFADLAGTRCYSLSNNRFLRSVCRRIASARVSWKRIRESTRSLMALAEARRDCESINPWCYDLSPTSIERFGLEGANPPPLPSMPIIEERPFIPWTPWRRATRKDLRTTPVLLKGPSNFHRLASTCARQVGWVVRRAS